MINGIITDKNISEGYLCFDTIPSLAIYYCADVQNGAEVKTYVKCLPNFIEIYDYFLSYKKFLFCRNKQLDICLSLFYNPYFDNFYEKIKNDYRNISGLKKKYILKYMLMYLADNNHYEIIVNRNMIDKSVHDYYIEKDIYLKSKELIELLQL